jgi:PIN domain nuclease of toxin-antitoxin system
MDILLDTCSALWFLIGDEKMPVPTRNIICTPENKIYVSIATVWEVAIKISINKLDFDGGINGFIDAIDENGFTFLSIDTEHTKLVANLPYIHRDPFDRMLVAQAKTNNITIMTTDAEIIKYDITSVW